MRAKVAFIATLLLSISALCAAAAKLQRSDVKASSASRRPHSAQKRVVKPVQRRLVDAFSGDDEEDDDPRGAWVQRTTARKAKGKMPKPSSLGALMKWTQRGSSSDQPSIREKMSSMITSVTTKGREIARFAKAHVSSAYEQALLAATWPDDMPVTSDQQRRVLSRVNKVADIVDALPPKDDPYRTTLHKLWMKMCEKDWRTTVKALYLLHFIVRESTPADSAMLMLNIRKMSKEINRKAAPMHYFNLNQVENLDAKGEPYRVFVKKYALFVFKRAMSFNSKFDELRTIDASTPADKAVHLLNRAIAVAKDAISCALPTKDIRNHITYRSVEQVAIELRQMWQLACTALALLIQEGSLQQPTSATIAMLEGFLKIRLKIQGYLADTRKTLSPIRSRIPTDMPDEPSVNLIERHLSELRRAQPAADSSQPASQDDHFADEEDEVEEYFDDEGLSGDDEENMGDEEAEDNDMVEHGDVDSEEYNDSEEYENDDEPDEADSLDAEYDMDDEDADVDDDE